MDYEMVYKLKIKPTQINDNTYTQSDSIERDATSPTKQSNSWNEMSIYIQKVSFNRLSKVK